MVRMTPPLVALLCCLVPLSAVVFPEHAVSASQDAEVADAVRGGGVYSMPTGEHRPQRPQRSERPEWVPEEPCSNAGGICFPADECPPGQLADKRGAYSLCPKQRAKGVECCHGLSIKERRCAKRGGECRPNDHCAQALRDTHATDCKETEVCCILVAL